MEIDLAGARHLLPAARRCLGLSGKHPGVKSIVGRFLEHRPGIVAFANGSPMPSSEARVFISSADWMPRNLDRRVECLTPIENPTVHQQVLHQILLANLKDEAQSWALDSDGHYARDPSWDHPGAFSAHEYFMTNPSLSGRGQKVKRACRARLIMWPRGDSGPASRQCRRHRRRLELRPLGHLPARWPVHLDAL